MSTKTFTPLFISFGLFAVACDATVEDPAPADQDHQVLYRTIDHDVLERLGPDEPLVVDVSMPDVAWVFDLDRGPIDLERITVVCPNGERMPLVSWFELAGKVPAPDSGGYFVLANDPDDFGTLDSEEVEMMWEISQASSFRAPAGHIEEIDVDGQNYLVCLTDDMFSCNDGIDWHDL